MGNIFLFHLWEGNQFPVQYILLIKKYSMYKFTEFCLESESVAFGASSKQSVIPKSLALQTKETLHQVSPT